MISVVLPTYNEAENIVPLIEAIDAAIVQTHEIIVVDDNSPDGTSPIVKELIDSGRVPGVRLKTRLTDRGLTKSLWEGITMAQGDVIVWMDCDFSMPPAIIPQLLSKIEAGFDIAVGSRFVKGGAQKGVDPVESFLAIYLSSFLNIVLRWSLLPRFHDYTSGFIAIRREVFTKIKLTGDYGEYFMDLMFRALLLKYSFAEIPYVCVPRRAGESKTAPNLRILFKRGIKYLWTIVRLEGVRVKRLLGGSIEDRDALGSSEQRVAVSG